MNKRNLLAICLLTLISISASAQFRKPLTSPRDRVQSSEARLNVGLLGGGNLTTWLHFDRPEASSWYLANYKPNMMNSLGFFGGIAIEYMTGLNHSLGLNVIYTQRNMALRYTNEKFPLGIENWVRREYALNAYYPTIEAYVPFTLYYPLNSKRTVMPYVFLAPRVSYILNGGGMKYSYTNLNIETLDTISSAVSQAAISDSTYRMLNVGATLGLGSEFRITTSNYYLIFKFDMSASMYGLQTFTDIDLQNEFNHLRYAADAQATLTFLLPIKKRLKGACMKWGEYD